MSNARVNRAWCTWAADLIYAHIMHASNCHRVPLTFELFWHLTLDLCQFAHLTITLEFLFISININTPYHRKLKKKQINKQNLLVPHFLKSFYQYYTIFENIFCCQDKTGLLGVFYKQEEKILNQTSEKNILKNKVVQSSKKLWKNA